MFSSIEEAAEKQRLYWKGFIRIEESSLIAASELYNTFRQLLNNHPTFACVFFEKEQNQQQTYLLCCSCRCGGYEMQLWQPLHLFGVVLS